MNNDFRRHDNALRLEQTRAITRRTFFGHAGLGLGSIALGSLLRRDGLATDSALRAPRSAFPPNPLAPKAPPLPARAKNVIYLHMSGAPPSLDLFDWKPKLVEMNLQPCPESLIKGERFAFIKSPPKMLGTPHKFARHGRGGAWVSELLPHFTKIADDAAVVKSMVTSEFNHAPAELFVHTGNRLAGSAAIGSWVTYGLGTENQDLPGFVVLLSLEVII